MSGTDPRPTLRVSGPVARGPVPRDRSMARDRPSPYVMSNKTNQIMYLLFAKNVPTKNGSRSLICTISCKTPEAKARIGAKPHPPHRRAMACPSPFCCKNPGCDLAIANYRRRSQSLAILVQKSHPTFRRARACPSPFRVKDAFGCSRRRGAECPLQPRVRLSSPPA